MSVPPVSSESFQAVPCPLLITDARFFLEDEETSVPPAPTISYKDGNLGLAEWKQQARAQANLKQNCSLCGLSPEQADGKPKRDITGGGLPQSPNAGVVRGVLVTASGRAGTGQPPVGHLSGSALSWRFRDGLWAVQTPA